MGFLAFLPVTVRAQQAAADSTVPVAPLLRSPARDWGARVLVIDSAEIAASTAPTFSELLQARLPGLRVLRSGGMASDGSLVMLRGPISFLGSSEPLVIVDGVHVDAEQADTLRLVGAVTPSRLDDLPVEDIARIEVLSGAAAAAYGEAAGSGVILVTTKSGAGPLHLSSRAQLLSSSVSASFPANYRRLGTSPTTGQPVANCSLLAVAAHSCNPTGLDVWNPLEQASPFRTAQSALAHLALSGTTLGTGVYASLNLNQREGVLPHDEASRWGYRAKIERELPGHFALRASHAFRQDYARMGLDGGWLIANDVISNGLLGAAEDDANRGYMNNGAALADSLYPDRRLRHTTTAIGASWEPGAWLKASVVRGRDRVVDRYRLDDIAPIGQGLLPERGNDEERRLTTTGRIVSAYAIRGDVRGSTALVLDWWSNRVATYDSVGAPSGAFEADATNFETRSHSMSLQQSVDLPHGVSLNGSLTRYARRFFGAEQSGEWFPATNVSWRTGPFMNGRSVVRWRAAYAQLAGGIPGLNTLIFAPLGTQGGSVVKMERVHTIELGVDASLDRLGTASLTVFRSTSTNLLDIGIAPPGPGQAVAALIPDAGEIRNTGVEALLHALLIGRGKFQWNATVSLAALSNRVTRYVLPPKFSLFGITREGSAVDAARDLPYTFADANHDGIIDVSEVQLLPEMAKPSLPTLEAGISSDFRLTQSLSLSALGDYRHGNMVLNRIGQVRCRSFGINCRAAQDPSASLSDQAAVAAANLTNEPVAGFVSDGSFFKLREVALRWLVPRQWSHYFGGSATITVAGRNLLTETNYSGIDPEISTSRPGFLPREEFGRNPIPREFLLRIDLGAGSP